MINIALIETYFSGKISAEELLEFHRLYESNPDFKAEVDFLKNVKSVAEKEDDAHFKTQLSTYESAFLGKPKTTVSKWIKPLWAVAAVILLGFCIRFFFNTSVNEDKLFATYFEPCKNVSVPIVRSADNETILKNAFIAYSEKDYEKANTLLENAFKANKNSELLFYQGNVLLALGDTEKAIEKFEEHLTYDDVLTNRSHWYLALAYLKTKQRDKAKQELNTFLQSPEGFKKTEARLLLKKLD